MSTDNYWHDIMHLRAALCYKLKYVLMYLLIRNVYEFSQCFYNMRFVAKVLENIQFSDRYQNLFRFYFDTYRLMAIFRFHD